MILDLVKGDDPILSEVMPEWDWNNVPTFPDQLARNLAETMIKNKGLGLSANQVGLRYRVFIMNGDPMNCCFNPIIVDSTTEMTLMEEGCLSFPNYYVKIKRPASIKARYSLANGEIVTRVFAGLTARIFQHELDHLNGVNYKDKANLYHRTQANKAFLASKKRGKND